MREPDNVARGQYSLHLNTNVTRKKHHHRYAGEVLSYRTRPVDPATNAPRARCHLTLKCWCRRRERRPCDYRPSSASSSSSYTSRRKGRVTSERSETEQSDERTAGQPREENNASSTSGWRRRQRVLSHRWKSVRNPRVRVSSSRYRSLRITNRRPGGWRRRRGIGGKWRGLRRAASPADRRTINGDVQLVHSGNDAASFTKTWRWCTLRSLSAHWG